MERWQKGHDCCSCCASVRCNEGELMVSACVDPTMKPGGGAVMVTLSDTDSDNISSGMTSVGPSFVFQQDIESKMIPTISSVWEDCWPRSRVIQCCITWPLTSTIIHLNPAEVVWDELEHRVKEKQPTSAQHKWKLLQNKSSRWWPHEASCRICVGVRSKTCLLWRQENTC